ncbi:MAG: S8 family serine peptidase [Actinomycetota bacterium]
MRTKVTSIIVFLALALAALPIAARAQESADPEAPGHAPGRALVAPEAHERDEAKSKIKAHGGRVLSYYEPGDFFVVETPGSAPEWIETLRGERSVRFAELDYELTADLTIPNDPSFEDLWGLHNLSDTDIDAPEAWDISTGSDSVVVGVIDTGVAYNHPDLQSQMWTNPGDPTVNGVDEDGNGYVDDVHGINCIRGTGDPNDDNDHGTHVAGTIGAAGDNGVGVAGVNWDVSIMALKFLDRRGSGFTSDAIECLDYATDEGVHLTSNSWGGGGFSTALFDAINRARTSGDLFVAAAGNDGDNTDSSPHYPSSYNLDNIISVAATTQSDGLASFSNYGPNSVDLGAPGVGILSTVRNGGYDSFSGTSMATPHVAGAAALLWAADGSLSWTQVRDAIFDNVDVLTSLTGKVVTDGRLNLAEAIASLGPPPPPPPAPDAPVLQSATAASHTQIDLVWSDVAGESEYNVERSADGDTGWTPVGMNAADDTTFSNTGLDPSTAYYYRVIASNAGGDSAPSNILSATTLDPPPVTSVHVGDLDGSSAGNKSMWTATVTITVHDNAEGLVSGVGVTVVWSNGELGTCTTGAAGTCSVAASVKKSTSSLSMGVLDLVHASLVEDQSLNHDPDGDSDGSTIVVSKP